MSMRNCETVEEYRARKRADARRYRATPEGRDAARQANLRVWSVKGREYRAHRRDQIRALIAKERDRRGNCCMDCGATENLNWHHRDPGTKLFGIARAINFSALAVIAELANCDLVCGPAKTVGTCHHLRHVKLSADMPDEASIVLRGPART